MAIGPSNRIMYKGSQIVVRSCDCSDMDMDSLILPQELQQSGQVPDAMYTQEYWYLKPVRVHREVYTIVNFSFEFDINWSSLKKKDVYLVCSQYINIDIKYSVQAMYDRTLIALEERGDYDAYDEVVEKIQELPWAQGLKISHLELR